MTKHDERGRLAQNGFGPSAKLASARTIDIGTIGKWKNYRVHSDHVEPCSSFPELLLLKPEPSRGKACCSRLCGWVAVYHTHGQNRAAICTVCLSFKESSSFLARRPFHDFFTLGGQQSNCPCLSPTVYALQGTTSGLQRVKDWFQPVRRPRSILQKSVNQNLGTECASQTLWIERRA